MNPQHLVFNMLQVFLTSSILGCLQLWDPDLVRQISLLPAVHRVVVLGTLCALELQAEGSNAGYVVYAISCKLGVLCSDCLPMEILMLTLNTILKWCNYVSCDIELILRII